MTEIKYIILISSIVALIQRKFQQDDTNIEYLEYQIDRGQMVEKIVTNRACTRIDGQIQPRVTHVSTHF